MRVLITKDGRGTDASNVFPFVRTLTSALHGLGVEVVTTPGSGEDVLLGVQWTPGADVVRDCKRRGVAVVHRLDGRARALVKNYDDDQVNREINAIADWTVFQSRYVLEHTTRPCETIFGNEAPIALHPDRGSIIYNGVDRSVFRPDGPCEQLDGEIRVLHVAYSAGIRKGVRDLVHVAKLLENNPRIQFYTIGRQEQDHAHGHEIASLKNITPLGVIIDRDHIARVMRSSHVLFFPSRNDYCPNTVIEAMSSGLPVWYHDSGGTPELVRDEHSVAGVPMIDQNPVYPLHVLIENLEEFSDRAIEMVERRFTMQHMGSSYLELFETLAARCAEAA